MEPDRFKITTPRKTFSSKFHLSWIFSYVSICGIEIIRGIHSKESIPFNDFSPPLQTRLGPRGRARSTGRTTTSCRAPRCSRTSTRGAISSTGSSRRVVALRESRNLAVILESFIISTLQGNLYGTSIYGVRELVRAGLQPVLSPHYQVCGWFLEDFITGWSINSWTWVGLT